MMARNVQARVEPTSVDWIAKCHLKCGHFYSFRRGQHNRNFQLHLFCHLFVITILLVSVWKAETDLLQSYFGIKHLGFMEFISPTSQSNKVVWQPFDYIA